MAARVAGVADLTAGEALMEEVVTTNSALNNNSDDLVKFRKGDCAMRGMNLNLERFRPGQLPKLATVGLILASCLASPSLAQQRVQKTFSSAEEASKALVEACQTNDEKALLEILGSGSKQVVSSGDDAQDKEHRANFVKRFEEMHRLVKEPDGTTTLYIGAENWPTPIPLVNKGSSWYFDTEAAKQEILFRRIGYNEMSTIKVCQELVAAEKEYRAAHQDEFARKMYSDEGKRDGLYWKTAAGQPDSPIGPLVASAVAEGYPKGEGNPPTPYRGYYFRILTSQGKDAPGGAKSYIANGKMTEGFAVIAYPAEYRSSGVVTFIVGQDGVVYQKDLGKKTEALAKATKEYNPDSTWQKAEEEQEETVGEGKQP